MSDYKIPLVPKLNFEKNEDGHYIFKIDSGLLECDESKYLFNIHNIEIDIYNEIKVVFEIKYDKFSADDYKLFADFKKNKYFDIFCKFNEYNITLLDFLSTYRKHSDKYVMSGVCKESSFRIGNFIEQSENVGVWNILECLDVSQVKYEEFKSNNLKGIFLKAKNTDDYDEKYKSIDNIENLNKIKKRRRDSFNQLLDNNAFLYYESTYNNLKTDIIDNIDVLLRFYDSNLIPSRFTIFKTLDGKKLEINIKSKSNYKLNGTSIFKSWPNNFFNFIDSTYVSYINIKNENEIDIDLLLYYYVWIKNEQYLEVKLMLCSAFLEVFTNSKSKTSKQNKKKKLDKKLNERLENLNLDTSKLLEYLEPAVFNIISKVEENYIEENYSYSEDITKICNWYKTEYLPICIKKYRNKIVHSGKFKITIDDLKEIMKLLKKQLKNKYNGVSLDCIEKIGNSIELKLVKEETLFDLEQGYVFEELIEIILLKYLNIDCFLNKNYIRKFLNFEESKSKTYLNKFIKT